MWRRQTCVVWAVAVLGCGSVAEDASDEDVCRRFEVADDVAFAPTEVGIEDAAGIVALRGTVEGAEVVCSALVVAPTVALTAAHCEVVARAEDASIEVDGRRTGLVELRPHPERDLMLVGFDGESASALPVLRVELDEGWVGRRAVVAGYGRTDRYRAGTLHFTTQRIASLDTQTVTVEPTGDLGACQGDSGGPLIMMGDDAPVVVGVLSTSSVSCRGASVFTRLDGLEGWLPEVNGSMSAACAGRDGVGMCGGEQASWCEGDVAWRRTEGGDESVDCEACGAVCGASPGTGEVGCVAAR